VALVAVGLMAACDGTHPTDVPQPVLTITFTGRPIDVAGLTLTTATIHLEHIRALGDAPPPGPPPGSHPDKQVDNIDLDLLGGAASNSVSLSLPQGLYSRVQFNFEKVSLVGTWQGTPLQVDLVPFQGPRVDLRATAGQELRSGQDGTFAIVVNPNDWFAAAILDSAMTSVDPSGGGNRIVCDAQNNTAVGVELTDRIGKSFVLQ